MHPRLVKAIMAVIYIIIQEALEAFPMIPEALGGFSPLGMFWK
jgi:hypothetical protein